jgi:hypothetical protein
MSRQSDTAHTATTQALNMTTLLTCGWGLVAFHIFFEGILVRHTPVAALAALLPLIAVWATLERKRWGRLALLGMSMVSPAVFVILFALAPLWLHAHSLASGLQLGLRLTVLPYGSPTTAGLVLLLSAASGIWLRRRAVIAEFDRGKRAALANAQRHIAAFLVVVWGAMLAMPAFMAGSHLHERAGSTHRALLLSSAARPLEPGP